MNICDCHFTAIGALHKNKRALELRHEDECGREVEPHATSNDSDVDTFHDKTSQSFCSRPSYLYGECLA
jgi:hypothetical protein